MDYKIRYACVCDKGKVRANNEDNFWCQGLYLEQDHEGLSQPLTGEASSSGLPGFAVFDGMGGESCGETASYLAADAFQKCYQQELAGAGADIEAFLKRTCREMNRAVYQYSVEKKIRSMGSTASMIVFGKDQIFIGNLGDTRIYHFYGNCLKQISREHSLKRFPGDRKGPLTQYVGIPESELQVSPYIAKGSYHDKDKYLICSDGLTDLVSEREISQVLSGERELKESARILLEMALDKGGHDNITILLCELEEQGENRSRRKKRLAKKWGIIGAVLLLGLAAVAAAAVFHEKAVKETGQEQERRTPRITLSPKTDPSGEQEKETEEEQEEGQEENTVGMVAKPVVKTESAVYTYEQMQEDLNVLEEQYPDLLQVNSLGNTADGREISEAVLGNPKASGHILIQASIHGREYLNTLLAMKQIEEYLDGYESGSYEKTPLRTLYQDLCIHVIPMANPDGAAISQSGPEGLRNEKMQKQVREIYQADLESGRTDLKEEDYWKTWKANGNGVDLNRNFDAGWQEYQGTSRPSSDGYKGTAPGCEPETRAILKVQQENPIVCCISYHSSGNLIYWNYGGQGQVLEQDEILAEKIREVTGYEMHSTVEDRADMAGCSDYFMLKLNIPAVTIENGTGTCPLELEEWDAIWEKNQNLFPALAGIYR